AEDDHRRATARCAELTARASVLARHGAPPDGPLPAPRSAASHDPEHAPPGVRQRTGVPRTGHSGTVRRAAPAPTTHLPPAPAPAPATAPGPEPATTREPEQPALAFEPEQPAPAAEPEQPASAVPATPATPTPSRQRPRRRRGGARFAGVEET
ncbi:hypothetical protein GTW38_17325, partial [Streptomyces sp. SID7804]|nr:hypothetical protein [Streptomyces sp. SID7804]